MAVIRRLFAGTNSGRGFFSFFEEIMGPKTKRVYLLKGGPGTGKSRFMSDIAEALHDQGYDQERIFCSSDPFSLDAVVFPGPGAVLVDATAPHALEAEWPGCRDELICLGNFWSSDVLIERREEIVAAGLKKRGHFAQAFRYFGAANLIEENIAARHDGPEEGFVGIRAALAAQFKPAKKCFRSGRARHLFASALTPAGYLSFAAEIAAECSKSFVLTESTAKRNAACLAQLATEAQYAGLDVEVFHYPLNPDRIQHVLIPSLKLGYFSETALEKLDVAGERICLAQGQKNAADNAGDQNLFQELIAQGVQSLQRAQACHGQVEEYYASQMDFAALSLERERVLEEILRL